MMDKLLSRHEKRWDELYSFLVDSCLNYEMVYAQDILDGLYRIDRENRIDYEEGEE